MRMDNTTTLEKFFQKKELKGNKITKRTKDNYTTAVNHFTSVVGKSIKTILGEAREEQTPYVNSRNQIIYPVIDESQLSDYVATWIKSEQDRGIGNSTINAKLSVLKAFFNFHNLKFPKFQLVQAKPKWNLLTKEYIENALRTTTKQKNRAVFSLALSSGMRISDICRLTVEDFLNAVGIESIKDLVKTRGINNIGYWEFVPQKTKNTSGITCMTCSTPEANNHIIDYLQKRHSQKPLELDQWLFMTQKNSQYNPSTMSLLTKELNIKLFNQEVGKLKQQFLNGEISEDKLKEEIDSIPKFHSHGLRKFFISVLGNEGVPIRVAAVMEGHVPPVKTDGAYVKITKETIMREYTKIVPALSFENVEVRVMSTEKEKEMENRLNKLEMLLAQRS